MHAYINTISHPIFVLARDDKRILPIPITDHMFKLTIKKNFDVSGYVYTYSWR